MQPRRNRVRRGVPKATSVARWWPPAITSHAAPRAPSRCSIKASPRSISAFQNARSGWVPSAYRRQWSVLFKQGARFAVAWQRRNISEGGRCAHQSSADIFLPSDCKRCARKKRMISRDASGPAGSVFEPARLPPDHAWPPPWTVQFSQDAWLAVGW